jgi:hypothetical protein
MVENRCISCILPEGYPGITLDEGGICTFCRDYDPKKILGEDELWDVVGKRRGKTYDVLVPVSGGRDSTFVLYKSAKRLGNRILALHFDNEFQVDQARENFLEAVKRLGLDYKIARSKHGFPKKIVRHAIKASLSQDIVDVVTNVCAACTYGYIAASYREAVVNGIPTILWGRSEEERRRFHPALSGFEYYKRRSKFLFSPRFYHFVLFLLYMILFQIEFWIPKSRFIHLKKPKYRGDDVLDINFFDYVLWDRREIKRTIMEDLGWKVPSGKVSSWRFDCKLHDLINYCYKEKYGFSVDIDGFANMVRAGKMGREKALRQEEELGLMTQELLMTLKNDINLSDEELSRYFQSIRSGDRDM